MNLNRILIVTDNGDKYEFANFLGKGSFSEVYTAKKINDRENNIYAIKIEDSTKHKQNCLLSEYNIYSKLKYKLNVPKIFWYGKQGEYNVMIMEHLGESLRCRFNQIGRFNLKTTLMVGYQIIKLLENLHDCGYLHRDIKPENFVFGLYTNSKKLFMIDFGLTKKYLYDGKHLPFKKIRSKLLGTPRYCSLNSHNGFTLSRRDDLESAFYMILYFYLGNLPWQKFRKSSKDQMYELIYQTKKIYRPTGLQYQWNEIFNYIRGLGYEERPNYDFICNKLLSMAKDNNIKFDNVYQWNIS